MSLAEMDASRLADQFEFGESLLHFFRREGTLRLLPATEDPTHLVCGHGPDDTEPDICMCAVEDVVRKRTR